MQLVPARLYPDIIMKKVSTSLGLALALALLAGCSVSSSDTGSAPFAVSVAQPLLQPVDPPPSFDKESSLSPSARPPIILRAYRSSGTAAGKVFTFDVVASDPQGSDLSYFWRANGPSLGAPVDEASRSRITWTAPSCVSPSALPAITVTVTNAFHLTATRSLMVTGLPVCSTAGWNSTGSMATPRRHHTAMLLPDGKVLVAGGYNFAYQSLATAEVYDPISGTWSATGSMSEPRYEHTATLLPNGKVLVSGGTNGSDWISTAEVYDPASGTWSATGSMTQGRARHTATLLPNGKVLVTTSGYREEVYDPASGTWSATGSMVNPRVEYSTTLLPNGKVLVAGGFGVETILKAAEVYDPASGTWSATGSMSSARYRHLATLLPNGKVLVEGGKNGDILVEAEVYDPASGTWSATGSMAESRYEFTATPLPNGKVLVTGGWSYRDDGFNGPLATAEVYDPASGTWSAAGAMAVPRFDHLATRLLDGRVLITGGFTYGAMLSTAEVYDPGSGP